jgi:tripartite-type tricarboxylate transporter receptor subunit TctC
MPRRILLLFTLTAVAVAVLLAGCGSVSGSSGSAALEDDPDLEAYFQGETITINVGFPPGGGYDTFARVFQRHASDHFPGNPRFVVENMPGAAGLRAKQSTMQADPDGLTVTLLHPTHVKRSLVGIEIEGFDVREIRIVGAPSMTDDPAAAYVRRDIATTWDEVQALGRDLNWGSTEPGAPAGILPEFLDLVGIPGFSVVHGYGGTSEILAAFDRGELEATGLGGPELAGRLFPEWTERQFHVPIVWWTAPLPEDFLDALGVEEVPHLFDVIDVTDEQREVFEISLAVNNITWAFALSPDTPDAVYEVWRESFEAVISDPGFVEDMESAGYEVGFGSAERIQELFEAVEALSPESLELFKQLSGAVE